MDYLLSLLVSLGDFWFFFVWLCGYGENVCVWGCFHCCVFFLCVFSLDLVGLMCVFLYDLGVFGVVVHTLVMLCLCTCLGFFYSWLIFLF